MWDSPEKKFSGAGRHTGPGMTINLSWSGAVLSAPVRERN
jgi:hypothetical protein